ADGLGKPLVLQLLLDRPRFAAAVSREDIRQGAEEVGMELDALIALVIDSLQREAETLDLT
ncbi:MAG: HAD family hydrolase, partial [Bacteroidota bacterium]